MKSDKLSRRQVLGATVLGLPAIPVETAFAQAKPAAGALPVLSPSEPAAKALGYVEDTKKVDKKANPNHKPEQHCGNCLQWADKDRKAALAKCNLFPGKLVKNPGWCKVWVKAPGVA
ncbi:MAG: hypothetical protein RL597_1522 [Pseudomonadota bacterium]